jgi:hemerythrin
MAITWNKKLEIGVESVDMQHKELVERFNTLMTACSVGRGQEELESSLAFLCDYTIKHFSDEEELQLQIGYPEFLRHKQLHEDFKVAVTNLVIQFKEEGSSFALHARLCIDVGDWVIKHIKQEDTKLASYVKK